MSLPMSFDRQSALDFATILADPSLIGSSLAHQRVLFARSPTCHRHRHATVTVSSGKPFDHQSALIFAIIFADARRQPQKGPRFGM